ncbi:MAG TPA: hypothetical protein VGL93_15020 [Streptosporangiaceae bacterium]
MTDARGTQTHRTTEPRSRTLMLINEQIARARIQERLAEAEQERVARRLIAIRRAHRRVERATARLRRLNTL